MIVVDHVVVSSDVLQEAFVCDLSRCKGGCCVEGDLGAPLEPDELRQLEDNLPGIVPHLTKAGRQAIDQQGTYVLDEEGDYSTPTVKGRECAFAYRDEANTLKCGIEKAHAAGDSTFLKPESCHLYPIRIGKLTDGYEALNYHRWYICSPACQLGEKLNVKIYQFLKTALIRRYGEAWYAKLEQAVAEQA